MKRSPRPKRRNKSRRFNQFRAALLWAGESQESWAKKHKVTASHVAQVARGGRESVTMLAKIDEFIAEQARHAVASVTASAVKVA